MSKALEELPFEIRSLLCLNHAQLLAAYSVYSGLCEKLCAAQQRVSRFYPSILVQSGLGFRVWVLGSRPVLRSAGVASDHAGRCPHRLPCRMCDDHPIYSSSVCKPFRRLHDRDGCLRAIGFPVRYLASETSWTVLPCWTFLPYMTRYEDMINERTSCYGVSIRALQSFSGRAPLRPGLRCALIPFMTLV